MERSDHLFFDLDGTLSDSGQDVLGSMEEAYRRLGFEYDRSKLRIGPLLPDIISAISPQLDSAQQALVAHTFRAVYAEGKYEKTVLYPYVDEFLREASDRGKTLYVATNKPKVPTYAVLEKLGIRDRFLYIGTPDSEGGYMTKPEGLKNTVRMFDLDPSSCLMVGDTVPDMQAGRYAGMQTLAFLGGYGEASELESVADYVFASYEELLGK